MKLRQKLAAVLAASMVVTAVPVVTMADTSNSSHCDVYVRDGSTMGYTVGDKVVINPGEHQTTGTLYKINSSSNTSYAERYITNLELFPKDNYILARDTKESFFVSLTDGEFNYAAYAIAMLNVKDTGKTVEELNPGTVLDTDLEDKFGTEKAFSNITDLGSSAKEYALLDGYIYEVATGDKIGKAEDLAKQNNSFIYTNKQGGVMTFTLVSGKEMRVDVYGKWYTSSRTNNATSLYVPIFAKAKSTQVKITVDGADSFVTSGTYTVGSETASGKELSIKADDATTSISVDGGEISKLVLTEEVLNAIEKSENGKLKLTLPSSSDLEFKRTGIKATGKRGFSGETDPEVDAEWGYTGRNNTLDKQVLIIDLPEWSDDTARGIVELEGIKVVPQDETAKVGDVVITAEAVKDDDFIAKTTLTVGKVCEYGVTLTCEKPAQVKAGRSAIVNKYTVTTELKENVKDSITLGRNITYTLENGYIIGAADILNWSEDNDYTFGEKPSKWDEMDNEQKLEYILGLLKPSNGTNVSVVSPKSAAYKNAAKAAIQHLVDKEDIKFEKNAKAAVISDVEINADGQVIGFTIAGDSIDGDEKGKKDDRLSKDEVDTLKVTMPVAATLQSTGEVTLVVSGRAFAELGQENKLSCKVADIVSPITVDVKAAELKVGLQTQASGEIVITETDKGMIEKGTLIIDANPEEESGIKFQGTPKVEATGLRLGDVSLSKDKRFLYIEVKATSTETGKIAITDMAFTTDRTVPEGTFPVRFYGDALTDEEIKSYDDIIRDKYVVKDFIKITTPNTQDIKNGALKAVTSTFTIDSNTYTVDGKEYQMDAQAYAKDGRTMVPLRYIAYAFGLEPSNVLFADSTATIIAGEKIIQVKLGSNIMVVNGSQIVMDAAAEMKDGRTFVPMSFIAAALGVKSSWNAETKTATFSNVAK